MTFDELELEEGSCPTSLPSREGAGTPWSHSCTGHRRCLVTTSSSRPRDFGSVQVRAASRSLKCHSAAPHWSPERAVLMYSDEKLLFCDLFIKSLIGNDSCVASVFGQRGEGGLPKRGGHNGAVGLWGANPGFLGLRLPEERALLLGGGASWHLWGAWVLHTPAQCLVFCSLGFEPRASRWTSPHCRGPAQL